MEDDTVTTATLVMKHGHQAIIVATCFTVLTTLAVALRLSTSLVTKIKFGWSEVFLLLGQTLWYAQYGAHMHGTIPYYNLVREFMLI